jgi:DNA-binding transcriptional LysR family regulator
LSNVSQDIFDLWATLNLRQFAAFKAVAATGSIARAAKQLGYTQPAISHQLASLERVVEARLFDRGSGRAPAVLTDAGRVFAEHLATLESRFASAQADLQALEERKRRTVRIGAFQSASARILPRLLQAAARRDPTLSLELTERANEADLLSLLARAELDLAFALVPLEDERFETVELLRDPYHLVGPVDGRYDLEIESLADLDGVPIVAPRSCRSWTLVAETLDAAGVDVRYAFRTDDQLALKALVESGVGVGLVTQLTLEAMGGGVASVPVDHLVPARRVAIARSRDRVDVPCHELVISLAREVCSTTEPREPERTAEGRRTTAPPSAVTHS